jgi:hypothetical protein
VLTYTQTTMSVHTSARTVAKASIERKCGADPYIVSELLFRSSVTSQASQQYSNSSQARMHLLDLQERDIC